ncbi:hypothetical protein TYRP_019675 [Tyrophagus putrescentiae]|nr:hypothetical protein TYRP_019675 [Tyrophagus putrescentiae]
MHSSSDQCLKLANDCLGWRSEDEGDFWRRREVAAQASRCCYYAERAPDSDLPFLRPLAHRYQFSFSFREPSFPIVDSNSQSRHSPSALHSGRGREGGRGRPSSAATTLRPFALPADSVLPSHAHWCSALMGDCHSLLSAPQKVKIQSVFQSLKASSTFLEMAPKRSSTSMPALLQSKRVGPQFLGQTFGWS